ncbi:mechanosensitive ion channel family protein [Flectobacillus rivi]|uniref:Mechanosensitive ion channel family protein n=1 Tax=Flectobacillus rivi TaxID=2984209 RepID=A0ABT6YZ86_9BACT|nr:mechanosensitive ion channel family protein [Flectobacillus rivi]MDI9873671.1 mechanosensitive ion channel family protein [Flectobacillus rivi]
MMIQSNWIIIVFLLGWICAGVGIAKTVQTIWRGRVKSAYGNFDTIHSEASFNDILLVSIHNNIVPLLAAIFLEMGVEYYNKELGHYQIYAGRIAHIFLIFSIAKACANFFTSLANQKMPQVNGSVPTSSIITNIIRVTIYIGALVMILQSVGISVAPALTALGVSGLAVALALQDTLSNLFAGLQLLVSKKIRPQDYVQLSTGEEGYIEDITWRNTTIRTMANHIVIVPNSKISTNALKNYNFPDTETPATVSIGISYDCDLEYVEKVAIEVAQATMSRLEGAVENFTPVVRFNSFEESSIKMTIIMRAKTFSDQFLIKHEFMKDIHKKFRDESIEIPFPTRTMIMKTPQEMAVHEE